MNSLPKDYTFGNKVIPQQIDESLAETLEKYSAIAKGFVTGWASVQLVISFFLAAGLKHLWSLTDTLQFIIFTTTYWSIQVPAVAEAVINMLKYVALGEFIPYYILTDWI